MQLEQRQAASSRRGSEAPLLSMDASLQGHLTGTRQNTVAIAGGVEEQRREALDPSPRGVLHVVLDKIISGDEQHHLSFFAFIISLLLPSYRPLQRSAAPSDSLLAFRLQPRHGGTPQGPAGCGSAGLSSLLGVLFTWDTSVSGR